MAFATLSRRLTCQERTRPRLVVAGNEGDA